MLGIKYGSNNTGTSEVSPQSITPGDSYYLRLIDMLTAKFPEVTFNFYNRAVGGALIQNSEDSQTFNGVTKAWPVHVKDTNPDILILAFGMNTNLENSKTFRYCMDRILNNLDTYTKKPSLCWVSTPRNTVALNTEWGTTDNQLSRHMAAYATRYYGRLKGGYIIDAGRASDVKRTGFDYASAIMKEVIVSEIISGTYTAASGVYTLDAPGKNLILSAQLSDFSLEFEMSVTGAVTGEGNLWIGYNYVDPYESVLLIKPNKSGVGRIESFSNYMDVAHYSSSLDYADSVTWNGGTWRTIRIEKRAENLNVYVNGVRVIRDVVAINNLPGAIRMYLSGTASAVYKIRNIKLSQGTYKQYVPTLTERDMWGLFIDGDYDTKPGNGGNGVNHPSTIGLDATYLPVLREFVDDLASISQKTMLSLGLIPIPRVVSTWQTAPAATSTSGANLRYQNVPLTDFPGVVGMTKPDGTRLTLRKDIQKYDDVIKLLAGEFAVYASGGLMQVFIAFTGTIEASYTLTAYYYA
ncbi:hypothetical protein D3C75_638630 [compost metagenome]